MFKLIIKESGKVVGIFESMAAAVWQQFHSVQMPEQLEIWHVADLDYWTFVEDALDAIKQGQTYEQFIKCHKPAMQADAAAVYERAVELVKTYGTQQRAANNVKRFIEDERKQLFLK